MKATALTIPEVILIEPKIFEDNRGHFFESFNHKVFEEIVNRQVHFVQDNQSHSTHNVLRGLHYQIKQPQGKLVRVVHGTIFDVAVDMRKQSPSFGQWVGAYLSAENKQQLWVPEGFAHGFLVISDQAQVLYKTTDYWAPQYERCVIWDDALLGIDWPIESVPVLGAKDAQGVGFTNAEYFAESLEDL